MAKQTNGNWNQRVLADTKNADKYAPIAGINQTTSVADEQYKGPEWLWIKRPNNA